MEPEVKKRKYKQRREKEENQPKIRQHNMKKRKKEDDLGQKQESVNIPEELEMEIQQQEVVVEKVLEENDSNKREKNPEYKAYSESSEQAMNSEVSAFDCSCEFSAGIG